MKSMFKLAGLSAITLLTSGFSSMAFANCGAGFACAVPEPSSLPLVGLGIAAAIAASRFFKKK